MLSFILDTFDRISVVDQERIAIVPGKHLRIFSKILDLYQTVFVLAPGPVPGAADSWRRVVLRPFDLQTQVFGVRQDVLNRYETAAGALTSYMSPKVTSSLLVVVDLRDESMLLAYRLLRSMRRLGIAPHVFLFLNFDRRSLRDFDKVNIASLVGGVAAHGKYTIIPFSYNRVMEGSARMDVVDYVERCLHELMSRLHERPATGTYVPLCFRFKPASIFRGLSHALKLSFYVFTGDLRFSVESLVSGNIDAGRTLYEDARRLEGQLDGRVRVNRIDDDRLDLRALAEYSLRDVVSEGVDIMSRTVSTGEVVEVLTSLRLLNVIKV